MDGRFFEILEAIPNIPRAEREIKHETECPCGGTIVSWREKNRGHIRAECKKCGIKLME